MVGAECMPIITFRHFMFSSLQLAFGFSIIIACSVASAHWSSPDQAFIRLWQSGSRDRCLKISDLKPSQERPLYPPKAAEHLSIYALTSYDGESILIVKSTFANEDKFWLGSKNHSSWIDLENANDSEICTYLRNYDLYLDVANTDGECKKRSLYKLKSGSFTQIATQCRK